MCDVMVALPDATSSGRTIFAKNSDRPAGECQPLHYSPGGRREGTIRCSYVEVPEAEQSLATFGCRPYWCWGYETGLNEAGVAGGNAAVFTRARRAVAEEEPGLTGMDLLRLGLERGRTVAEAVDVIVALLEEYGQWGSAVAGKDHAEGGYDNSFLLADDSEAWVLETAGRRWAAERVVSGVRTISNELSIREQPTRASGDLAEFAGQQGWMASDAAFDFALAYSDHEHYPRQVSHVRRMRSDDMLRASQGKITPRTMMRVLRDHYEDTFLDGPQFHQFLPDFLTLCMHDSPAKFTWGNTATSVVVELGAEGAESAPFWLSYLPPCCGVFTAYFLGETVPETVTTAGTAGVGVHDPRNAEIDTFRESSLWWRFHRIHAAVAERPGERFGELRAVLDPVEKKLLSVLETAGDSGRTRVMEEEVSTVAEALTELERRWELH